MLSSKRMIYIMSYSSHLLLLEIFVIHRSELEISNLPGPTNTHMYWCELHTPDVALQSNYSDVFANRVTVMD